MLTAGSNNNSTTYSGTITGAGGIVKTGAGVWTLAGTANTYTGGTMVLNGSLKLGANQPIPQGSTTTIYGTLDRDGYTQKLNNLTLAGGAVTGTGALNLNGTLYSTGSSIVSGGTLLLNGDPRIISVDSGTLTIADALAGGPGWTFWSFNKYGDGTLVLSNSANSLNGYTKIIGGTLRNGADYVLGPPGPWPAGIVQVANGATWDLDGHAEKIMELGNYDTSESAVVNLNGGTLEIADASYWSFAGDIAGSGALVKSTSGNQTLTKAALSLNGTILVTGGDLNVEGTFAVNALTASGGVLALDNAGIYSANVLVLNGGTVAGNGGSTTVLLANALDLQSGSISVNLGGAASLTKTTGGTVILSGSNGFSGTSSVSAGTLTINGPTSYGVGSALNLTGGTLNLNSSGGDNTHRYLAVAVSNATLAVGATQYLASLSMTNSARAVGLAGHRGHRQQHDQDRFAVD